MTQKRTVLRNGLIRTGLALAIAGCLSVPAVLAQSAGNDGNLQSAVESALAKDSALQGQQVQATAQNGEVTLSGTVQTAEQRQEAETVAANVPGVVGIADNIQVAGESAPAPATAPAPPQMNPPAGAQQTPPPPPPDQTATPAPYQGTQPYQGYGSEPPSGPVTIPAGTLLQVRTSEPLNVTKLQEGATFEATAASDVYEGNVLAIPRGAVLEGKVVKVKKPGALGGSGELELQITQLNLGGKVYPVATDIWSSKGPNKAGYTAGNTAGGAIMGALIGGIIGRGPGAAIGAVAGGGAGLLASAETNGPREVLPPEALLNFHLSSGVTVQPVSWQEAQRLAQNAPQLRRRPVYYAPYPYPYYPYRYAYYPY